MRLSGLIFFWFCCGYYSCFSQIDTVDFLSVDALIQAHPGQNNITGTADYNFRVLKSADSVSLDAKNIQLLQDKDALSGFKLTVTDGKIWIHHRFIPEKIYTARISYKTTPKQAMYFFGDQIWTQGQGKYTSHWLPSIDDVNDKLVFNISVATGKEFTAISNGVLSKLETSGNNTIWHYRMQKPMSSYLAALVVGDFEKTLTHTASGIPVELYISSEDKDKLEPTYRHTLEIFDFLEREIGVPYPWQVYKQVPVRDFLYSGMENTSLTIFSSSFVVDEIGFNDQDYVNVNAHELAHQWFGNLVTAASEEHHWLQEGFATYYALLAEKQIFGEDYFYYKLMEAAVELAEQNEPGSGERLLSKGASSLTYYQKGAWALFALHSAVGDYAFKNAVKSYLEKHSFSNVTTDDFLTEVTFYSKQNLDWFKEEWLDNKGFPTEKSKQLLSEKSSLFREIIQFEQTTYRLPLSEKKEIYTKIFQKPVNQYLARQVFNQLSDYDFEEVEEFYLSALQSDNVIVGRLITEQIELIPESIKKEYETLLDTPSYYAIEKALLNLWISFPEEQVNYLKKTESLLGMQNKNVRMLWLMLSVLTDEFSHEERFKYYAELTEYTSPKYSFEIRREAFERLFLLVAFSKQNLDDLVEACFHPNWRFSSFAKDILSELLKSAKYHAQLSELVEKLEDPKKSWLQTQLDKY